MGKETKQFVVITDRGIMGRGMKADMVMARLLFGDDEDDADGEA